MKVTKILLVALGVSAGLMLISGCADSTEEVSKIKKDDIPTSKKLQLTYYDNAMKYDYRTTSNIEIGYMNDKNEEKKISVPFDYSGDIKSSYRLHEHILTDQNIDPYVKFSE